MTPERQDRRGKPAGVSLAAWLLAAAGLAGMAGPGPAVAYDALNTAVNELARNLKDQLAAKGALEHRPVLVTPDGFFELGKGMRLPLSETLSEGFRDALHGYGVTTVLIPGDHGAVLDLKGKWRGTCEQGLSLQVSVNRLTDSDGVVPIATASKQVTQVDPDLCKRDIDFLGRDVVRQLERGLRDKRTVYVRPVSAAGDVPQPERLGEHLASWLESALAQDRANRRLRAIEPAARLGPLPSKELVTRGMKPGRSAPGETAPSVVADMVQAQSELVGMVDVHEEHVRVDLRLVDSRSYEVVRSASAELHRTLLPPDLWKPVSRCYARTLPENPDLGLDLGTDHGERRVTYRDGDRIRFVVRVDRPSHVYLFDINSGCEVVVLYPRPDISGSDVPARRCFAPYGQGTCRPLMPGSRSWWATPDTGTRTRSPTRRTTPRTWRGNSGGSDSR